MNSVMVSKNQRHMADPRSARLWRDRRGAMTMVFAVAALLFFGLIGLAVEGGSWYANYRTGQNAADAAASAGANELAASRPALVSAAGIDTAMRNGFSAANGATVTINHPPSMGAYTANNYAVEAIITRPQPVAFGRLFSMASLNVTNRAVALMISTGEPCILALGPGSGNTLQAGGNDTVTGPNCLLASNSTDATSSIKIYGSADLDVYSLRSVGGCNGCGSRLVTADRPYTAFAAPMSNPFATLDAWNAPSFNSASCLPIPDAVGGVVTMVPYEANGRKAYCSDLRTSNGSVVDFQPGTFFFNNAGLTLHGGTVGCSACFNGNTAIAGINIILTGSPGNTGGVDINAQTTLKLTAKISGNLTSALQGVLIYRVADSGGDGVRINGGANTWWQGGIYFPHINVQVNGNSSNGPATCTVIVAAGVDLTGTSNNYFNNAGCPGMGIDYQLNRSVLLVE